MQWMRGAIDLDEKPHATRMFVAGISVFLIVKLLWIWVPVGIMGMPRLGDDALVYLWWGLHNFIGNLSPAVRDVLEFHRLHEYASAIDEFSRNRVTMRVAGSVSSPISAAVGALVGIGIDPKWVFAIEETVILFALVVGLALLLYRFVGVAPGGVALILLAFIFLPGQGLHFLIPGVLALSLGMILAVQSVAARPNLSFVYLISVLALTTHQIGLVYIAICAALNISHAVLNRTFGRGNILFVTILAAAVITFAAWSLIFAPYPESSAGRGALSFSNLIGNFSGIWNAWSRSWQILVVSAIGTAWGILHFRLASPALPLTFVTFGAIAASLAYDIPGYPGDVGIRLLVVPFILACGGAGAASIAAARNRLGRPVVTVLLIAVAIYGSVHTYRSMIGNANGRYALFVAPTLRSVIGNLDRPGTILYTDVDFGMMYALLAGADRLGAIPFPAIRNGNRLAEILHERKPKTLALVPPRELSGYSAARTRTLKPRFYGYAFDEFVRVEISSASNPFSQAYVRFAGPLDSSRTSITLATETASRGKRPCQTEPPQALGDGWYRVGIEGCSFGRIEIVGSPDTPALTGVALEDRHAAADWPWGRADTVLRAEARESSRVNRVVLDFSWNALLAANDAAALADYLAPFPELISDRGGLILAKIRINDRVGVD